MKAFRFSLHAAFLACAFGIAVFTDSLAAEQSAASRYADPQEDLRRVIQLVSQRLSLMPDVAAWKWAAKQPIVDAAREAQVLERSVADAMALGLDANAARQFFDLQIRMARSVQYRYFEEWRQSGTQIPKARDLNTEIRPALDALGGELLIAIYSASDSLPVAMRDQRGEEDIAALRTHRGVEASHLIELRAALATLRVTSHATLERVQRAGLLRVGTTGDYAPFSSDQGSVLRGFDIDQATELARRWKVSIKFIRTSWPTLMNDYQQHRFDIALSGISVTPERQAIANFSRPYHVDGKTPIVRCEDKRKYSSLKRIDRYGVRVIVNPGGTNERFARERLSKASLALHSDNRTIFNELISGRADVMFTDGIEVTLQTRRHPQLCGSMKTPLTRAPKAILLPLDKGIAIDVDEWLAPKLNDGIIAQQIELAIRASL